MRCSVSLKSSERVNDVIGVKVGKSAQRKKEEEEEKEKREG